MPPAAPTVPVESFALPCLRDALMDSARSRAALLAQTRQCVGDMRLGSAEACGDLVGAPSISEHAVRDLGCRFGEIRRHAAFLFSTMRS
jgi:hypothetical protein